MMRPRETSRTALRAPTATYGGASLLIMITSLFALDGCQAIKSIFEVGFGVGVVVVIALVAIIGGIVAMASRRK
jgi:hypothetical protein